MAFFFLVLVTSTTTHTPTKQMVLGVVLTVYDGIAGDLDEAEKSGGVLPIPELLIEAFFPFEFGKTQILESANDLQNLQVEVNEELNEQIGMSRSSSFVASASKNYSEEEPISADDLEAKLTAQPDNPTLTLATTDI